jgi:hypothetical protein
MALPAEARLRWDLGNGGSVEIVDLGPAILVAPAGRGGLRALLRDAIESAGGSSRLATDVSRDEPDLT